MQIIIPPTDSGILAPDQCPLCKTSTKTPALYIVHELGFCKAHKREFNAYLEWQKIKIYLVVEILCTIVITLIVQHESIILGEEWFVWGISLLTGFSYLCHNGITYFRSRHYLRDHPDFLPHYHKDTLYIESTNFGWNELYLELNAQLAEAQSFVKEDLLKKMKADKRFVTLNCIFTLGFTILYILLIHGFFVPQ